MVRDTENNRLDLRGNVQVVFQNQHLYCKRATVDLNKKEVVASGEVSLISQTKIIEGDRVKMNYITGHGTIYNGFVRAGAMTFEGKVIHKVGEKDFNVEDGYYTACKSCPAAWSFTGSKINAEIGGYAYITSPVFRFAEYPFFWLPYLIVPLKSKRQTGFLFPTFGGTKSGGTEYGESFFWAVNDHKDFTFTLKNYSSRGPKLLVNHRFFMDTNSYGELDMAYINDKVFPSDPRLEGFSNEESIERWFLKYFHYYNLPGGFIQRTKLNLVSDLKYPFDFNDETEGHGEPALENRMSLTKNTENWHSHLEAAYYINMLKTNVKEGNDDAVHRFPEIQVNLTEKEIGRSGFLFSLNTNYTNFARNNLAYDDIVFESGGSVPKRFNSDQDGEFNFDGVTSADQIRSGQRLMVQPKVSYPFKLGSVVDFLPSVSYFDSTYQFDVGDERSARRNYVRTSLSARANFNRVYESNIKKQERIKHEIIPEIQLTHIPISSLSDHAFLGSTDEFENIRSDQPISDEDFYSDSGIQFDYFDRIEDRKLATFLLSNRLTEKTWRQGVVHYRQLALMRISQSYDFLEAEQGGNDARPWSDIEALLDFRFNNFQTNTLINHYPYHKVTNINSRVRIRKRRNYVDFIYSRHFNIGENTNIDPATRSENLQVRLAYISTYLDLIGETSYNLVSKELLSWTYQVNLKPPGDCWGFVFRHQQILGGEAIFNFSFAYSFDGKKAVSINDQMF